MGVFEMVAIIVTVSVVGGIINNIVKANRAGGGDLAKKLKVQEAELEAMKKRVRNLETIIATEPEPRRLELEEDIISYDAKLENQLSKTKKKVR
jgi:hypothetical protein